MDSDLDITMTDVPPSSTTSPAPWNRALSTAWPPATLQKLYDDKYKPQSKEEEEQTEEQERPDFLDSYLEDILPGAILEDQYTSYAFGPQTLSCLVRSMNIGA